MYITTYYNPANLYSLTIIISDSYKNMRIVTNNLQNVCRPSYRIRIWGQNFLKINSGDQASTSMCHTILIMTQHG
jgi:hypothetical protein